jgi:hypothetical protein
MLSRCTKLGGYRTLQGLLDCLFVPSLTGRHFVSGHSKPATFWNRKQLLGTARVRDEWSMSNSLKVSLQTTIYSLSDRGWSRRRIARELGIDRETVGRYLRLAKPAISTTGLEGADEAKPAIPTAGFEEAGEAEPAIEPAISTAGNGVGRKSQCEPLAEVIKAKAELGLSAQRIYQDLVGENSFTDSYQSVKRFVRPRSALCMVASFPSSFQPFCSSFHQLWRTESDTSTSR